MADLTVLQQAGILTGMVAGVAGMTLGVLNAIHQRSVSKPKLRIDFDDGHVVAMGGDNSPVSMVQIANIGRIPVHGGMIGGRLNNANGDKKFFIPLPVALDRGEWPRTIEPGRLVMLSIEIDSIAKDTKPSELLSLTFTSAVGQTFSANRKAMKKLREAVAESRAKRTDSSANVP